ncbi:MAG: PH domain-containing protein [Ethanoligenens sp.]
MMKYGIEKSIGNTIFFLMPVIFFGAFELFTIILLAFYSILGFFLVWSVLFAAITSYFMPIIFSSVMLNNNSLKVHCGLICQKRIMYSEIMSIGATNRDKEYIHKGNPAYSNNIIKICYGKQQEVYISVKNPESFISDLKNRIRN